MKGGRKIQEKCPCICAVFQLQYRRGLFLRKIQKPTFWKNDFVKNSEGFFL